MAIFKSTDPRSLSYKNKDEVIEKIVESFGYKKNTCGKFSSEEKTYILYNNYQVHHWDRTKRGFLNKEYKGFRIMEHYDDGLNAKNTIRYGKPRKYYSAYIDISGYTYIYLSDIRTILTQEEIVDYANGDKTHAMEKSIATEMKDMYMDHVANTLFNF